MLKSRAITVSFRFYGGLSAAALFGALVAALASNTSDSLINRTIGPLSIGWKGSVGDHLAYTVLLGVAVVSGFVGILLTAFRDGDASAQAEVVQLDSVPLTRAPVGASYWPIIAAFAVAVLLIGLSISSRGLALAAAAVLGVSVVTWTLRAWAERATGDDRTNLELYQQVLEPMGLPAMSLLLVGAMVIGFSRVLLTLPTKTSSVAVFGLLGVVVLLGSIGIALKPRISKSALTLILFVFGLVIIVSGVIGAARGSREFEVHETPTTEVPAGQGG
jgi:hypothetical protein